MGKHRTSDTERPTADAVAGPQSLRGRSNYAALIERRYSQLFYNFKCGALAMARSGAGEQRANSLNGLPAATDHTTHVALSKLKLENGCSGTRNFREHHVVRKFDQLPNDELEKFSHCQKPNHESAFAQCYGATGKHESTRILVLQRPSAVGIRCPQRITSRLQAPAAALGTAQSTAKNSRRTAPLCSQMLDGYRCRF